MKTQIIHLESYDDFSSISDRIKFIKSSRVLIVWPAKMDLPVNRVLIARIQRAGQQQGLELGMVCPAHNSIRQLTAEAGIPAFNTIEEAQKQRWFTPPKPDWRRLPRNREELRAEAPETQKRPVLKTDRFFQRKIIHWISAVALIGLILYLLPGAKIVFQIRGQESSMRIPFHTSPDIQTAQVDGSIPSEIRSVQVEGSLDVKTSGQVSYPDTPAKGTIDLVNLTGLTVNVPAGTVVKTTNDPVLRFSTQQAVKLLPVSTHVEVPIQALTPGSAGNIAAGTIQIVEGDLGLKLQAANPSAISGGTDRMVPASTQEDYDQGKASLSAELEKKAGDQLRQNLAKDELLIGVIRDEDTRIEESALPEIGKPGSVMRLTLKTTYLGILVQRSQMEEIAGKFLGLEVKNGFQPGPDQIQFGEPDKLDIKNKGEVSWIQPASRTYYPQVDSFKIRQSLPGRQISEAKAILQKLVPGIENIEVSIFPSFWTRMPLFYGRMNLTILEDTAYANSGN
jgi:hypothetical protein